MATAVGSRTVNFRSRRWISVGTGADNMSSRPEEKMMRMNEERKKCYSNVITTTPETGSKPKSQSSYINMRGFFWPLLIFYPFLVFTYIRNRCTYIPLESGRMVKKYNKMKSFLSSCHTSHVCALAVIAVRTRVSTILDH